MKAFLEYEVLTIAGGLDGCSIHFLLLGIVVPKLQNSICAVHVVFLLGKVDAHNGNGGVCIFSRHRGIHR